MEPERLGLLGGIDWRWGDIDPASTVEDLAAEVQRRAPEHAAEYAAVEVLVRLRINEWEQER